MALRTFNPDSLLQDWSDEKYSPFYNGKTLARSLRDAFDMSCSDSYVYRAQAETTLDITQRAIVAKRELGLHGWYHDNAGRPVEPQYPSQDEVAAYTSLFDPSLNLAKALNSFKANSKANTLRSGISSHLCPRFYNITTGLLPPKRSRTHTNPYLSLWMYACHELEWAGPLPSTTHTKISHHILPLFYHHFGCIVPSYAALHAIVRLAQPAKPSKEAVLPILDIGSGNGYWTFMLRRFPLSDIAGAKELDVRAIDNQISEYRVSWVPDTITADGSSYLRENANGKGCILLLVYPQATGDFTGPIMGRFEGDTIVVAGTQNGNGFTGFQDQVVDEWVAKKLSAFDLTLRMPLPSFAGKDEALFVFQRRKT